MSDPDTIVAISTPTGTGGIGIVRLSGPLALSIGRLIFATDQDLGQRPRYMIFGKILDTKQRPIDTALACFFKGPDSYTGEDLLELSCHGSSLILDLLVRTALTHGACLAGPGEFTRRAFINGKIDLVQAEAVTELIYAGSRAALDNAYGQNSGRLSALFYELKSLIVKSLSLLEIGFDFVDEDTALIPLAHIQDPLEKARSLSLRLIDTFEGSRRRLEGTLVVLIGRPNVGKSTLLNALLNEERAIVTAIPGTTRDTIEGQVIWNGEMLRLIDTAGIRSSDADLIEKEGIRRSLEKAKAADVLIGVFNSASTFSVEDQAILNELYQSNASLIVCNKVDLPNQLKFPAGIQAMDSIDVSALSEIGLSELKERILSLIPEPSLVQGIGITRQRHFDGLSKVLNKIDLSIEMLNTCQLEECIAVELYDCMNILANILGENLDDDVLDLVFSDFCIGK